MVIGAKEFVDWLNNIFQKPTDTPSKIICEDTVYDPTLPTAEFFPSCPKSQDLSRNKFYPAVNKEKRIENIRRKELYIQGDNVDISKKM